MHNIEKQVACGNQRCHHLTWNIYCACYVSRGRLYSFSDIKWHGMPNEKERKKRRNKSNAQWALLSIQNKCRQWVRQTKYYFHQIRILGLIPLHFANFIRAHFGIRKECLNIKNLFGDVFFLYAKETYVSWWLINYGQSSNVQCGVSES